MSLASVPSLQKGKVETLDALETLFGKITLQEDSAEDVQDHGVKTQKRLVTDATMDKPAKKKQRQIWNKCANPSCNFTCSNYNQPKWLHCQAICLFVLITLLKVRTCIFMYWFKLIRNIAATIVFIVMLKIVVYLLEILLMFKGIRSGAHSLFIKVIELLTKCICLRLGDSLTGMHHCQNQLMVFISHCHMSCLVFQRTNTLYFNVIYMKHLSTFQNANVNIVLTAHD